jgi:hypothetical protein
MGELHRKMSWEGKNHDASKTTAKSTLSKEPVTLEQLAEVEENILKMLDEVYEKFSTKEAEENKQTKKD